ncbi:Cant1, partial [Symbiodinium necroappetens]
CKTTWPKRTTTEMQRTLTIILRTPTSCLSSTMRSRARTGWRRGRAYQSRTPLTRRISSPCKSWCW